MRFIDQINEEIEESIKISKDLMNITSEISKAVELVLKTFKSGCRIFLCGNGGSAADAQHIACELVGKFLKIRDGLPAIALTTDTSVITSISNDFGYDKVFSRQIDTLGKKGDALVAISTSGSSKNVLLAVDCAKKRRMNTIALTGCDGGELKKMVDISIVVPSCKTPRIQEAHITIGHILSKIVEREFF